MYASERSTPGIKSPVVLEAFSYKVGCRWMAERFKEQVGAPANDTNELPAFSHRDLLSVRETPQ